MGELRWADPVFSGDGRATELLSWREEREGERKERERAGEEQRRRKGRREGHRRQGAASSGARLGEARTRPTLITQLVLPVIFFVRYKKHQW